MKNIFRFLMAVTVLFTASCAKEDISSSIAGGEVEVTFTANLPELGTRAYGDGTKATTLRYYVYDGDTYLQDLSSEALPEKKVTLSGGKATVTLTLLKGMTYNIVFWADNGGEFYSYDTASKTITVDYTGAKANDDNRDAFFGKVVNFDPVNPGDMTSVELRRPFAQLNAITNDCQAVLKSGIAEMCKSSLKVTTPVCNKLDLLTGDASGEASVEYTLDDIPAETKTITKDETTEMHLAMNYLLVNGEKSLVDVEFTFVGLRGTEVFTFTPVKLGNIPVQRNYRTNIIGKLLTKSTDFEVEIKPGFDEQILEPDALVKAAINGGEFTLTEDIELTQPLYVASDLILNLNGKTITGTMHKSVGAVIKNEGTLTIKGGTISSTANNGGSAVQNSGTLVVEDATLNGAPNADGSWPSYAVNNTGLMTISNTKITSYHGAVASYGDGAVVTLNDSEIDMSGIAGFTSHGMYTYNNGKIVVNGGTYANKATDQGASGASVINGAIEVNAGTFSGRIENYYGTPVLKGGNYSVKPNANFIAAGYKAVEIGDLYYVLPEVIADAADAANVTKVTESTADVATALANNNGEVTMFMWNDVAYIAKYGEVVITSAADEATTVRGVVESAAGLTSATVAEGVEVVGNRTFRKCANLETVALPNTLTEIGPAVFQSCPELANVTIPASVTTIGEGAFAECTSLTSINIPEGITRLEKDVLRNTGLVSIEIPASVNYIGTYAFRDCKQLKKVVINAPEFTMEGNTFGIMAAPFTPMTIEVANAEMKAYVESKLTAHAKTYITVVFPEAVSNAEQLTEALANGENVKLTQDIVTDAATTAPYGNKYAFKMDGGVLDGNGHELHMECYGDDYGIMTSGGTIKNLTIKEGCRAVMIMYPQQDIILDNVKIGGDGVLYPINTGEAGADGVDLIVTNSVLAGWTSYGLIASASFTNVEFKQGTYYNNIYGRVLKPYVNTTLTNCSFVKSMNLDLSSLTAGHKVTMKNCTVNGQVITVDTFTIPTSDAQYNTELFTVDLPSWATSINDCIVFE